MHMHMYICGSCMLCRFCCTYLYLLQCRRVALLNNGVKSVKLSINQSMKLKNKFPDMFCSYNGIKFQGCISKLIIKFHPTKVFNSVQVQEHLARLENSIKCKPTSACNYGENICNCKICITV